MASMRSPLFAQLPGLSSYHFFNPEEPKESKPSPAFTTELPRPTLYSNWKSAHDHLQSQSHAALTSNSDAELQMATKMDEVRRTYFGRATFAALEIKTTVSLSTRMRVLSASPTLQYERRVADIARPSITIAGLSAEILSTYCANADEFIDDQGTFLIPASFYKIDAWPYDLSFRDGRPFTNILQWLRHAFADPDDRVYVQICLDLDELIAHLSGCLLLGMRREAKQIEALIKNVLRYRPLNMKEVKAVWAYHKHPPNPFPETIEVPKCFMDAEMMRVYAVNLIQLTSRQWRDDKTGKFDMQRVEFNHLVAYDYELRNLLYRPHLGTWVRVLERVPDREWKRARLAEWVEQNGRVFGRGRRGNWPVIVPLYRDDRYPLVVLD